MNDWSKEPREMLRELLHRPLPEDPNEAIAAIAEIQRRLEMARHYDSTVYHTFDVRDSLVRDGNYDFTREKLYAVLAFNLLKAKASWEQIAMELGNTVPRIAGV